MQKSICADRLTRGEHAKAMVVDFSVVQAIQHGKWKWTVSMDGVGTKTGLADNKPSAVAEAQRAIVWLHAKKLRRETADAMV